MKGEILSSKNLDDTLKIAGNLSKDLKVGDVVTLTGNLGAGKTAFAKGLISALTGCNLDEVTSPTFNICQNYKASDKAVTIWHYDLYRLESMNDLLETGIEDILENSITIIEWPEVAEEILPKTAINIKIEFVKSGSDERSIEIS